MPTTNKPAPVATGTDPGLTNIVTGPVGPLDTAPEPVPPGPGLGVTATIPTPVPVVTAQTETVDVAAATASSFVPNTISTNTVVKYLSVSDESVAISSQVTNINFVGTGVSVANNANAINSVTVTINGGGTTYGNSNVVTLLAGFGSNVLSTTGNVTGGNLITGAQVVASGVIQSGTGLSTGGYLSVNGTADLHDTTVNGSLSVTGNLTVTGTTSTVNTEVVNVSESVVGNIDAGNLRTAGQVTATGNITGNFFIGNGSTLSSVTASNVTGTVANATYALSSNAATYATQAITAGTANAVAGANVSGTVANATYALTSNAATYATQATYANTANAVAGANVSGTVANATSAGSATTAGTVTTAAQGNITSVGILTSLSVSGNITAANLGNIASVNLTGNADTVLYGNGTFALPAASSSYGNANVTTLLGNLGSNVISSTGNISTTANISGGYILGNGSQLTSLPAPTVSQDITSVGAMSIMTYDGNLKYASYATIEPVSGNITAGNISTTGNIIAGNVDTVNLVVNNISSDDSTLVSVQDGLQVYGNIVADNLGNIASINLDGNVSNVLSGTGTWIAAGGGAANTGNVTFNNQIVLGTGSNDGSGGLYLAPGTDSIANSAVQYLRVRGGDVVTHIHLDTGNNQYYDQYFGDDGKYVKLANTGNVVIGSDDAVGNSAQWTFGTSGNLTVPGSIINDTSIVLSAPAVFNTCTIATAGSGYNVGSSLKATTGGSGSGMTVGIGYGLSNQLTSVTVVSPGTGYVNGDVITVAEGTGGTFVITKYNQSANQANNNTVQSDLTFANNVLELPIYGAIATDANMVLTTNLANTGNTSSWTFGTTGNLTLPGNTFAVNYANGTAVSLGSGTVTNVQGNGIVSGLSLTGNVTTTGNLTLGGTLDLSSLAGNITTAGQVSATGNITTANSFVGNLVGTTVSVTGNVSVGGNLTVTGGIHKSNRIIATTASLTVADAGGFIQFNSGPYTVTLPDPTQAVNAGIGYRFWQNTASNITLSTPAGAFFGPSGTTTSTQVLAQATTQYWDVWSDGFNWAVFGIKIA